MSEESTVVGAEGAGDAGPMALLRVERGNPLDDELAAVVAVLTAAAASTPEQVTRQAETFWNRPAHRRRAPRSWAEARLPS